MELFSTVINKRVISFLCSTDFAEKVVYANRLSDLEEHLYLAQLDIPELVKK
jgi:hypothetical protein